MHWDCKRSGGRFRSLKADCTDFNIVYTVLYLSKKTEPDHLLGKKKPNIKSEVVKKDYAHLKDLWFPDVSEKDTLEVDMLIGMDLLWQIQTGCSARGNPSEPVVIETIFRWTLAGKLGESHGCRTNAHVNLVIEDRKGDTMEENFKIWDYETLGIAETDVYEDLENSICFNGQRYSVKLPWRAGNYHLPTNYKLSQSIAWPVEQT